MNINNIEDIKVLIKELESKSIEDLHNHTELYELAMECSKRNPQCVEEGDALLVYIGGWSALTDNILNSVKDQLKYLESKE